MITALAIALANLVVMRLSFSDHEDLLWSYHEFRDWLTAVLRSRFGFVREIEVDWPLQITFIAMEAARFTYHYVMTPWLLAKALYRICRNGIRQ